MCVLFPHCALPRPPQSLKLHAEVSISGDSRVFRQMEILRKENLMEFSSPSSCRIPEETDPFMTAAVWVSTCAFISSGMKQVVVVVNGPVSTALVP